MSKKSKSSSKKTKKSGKTGKKEKKIVEEAMDQVLEPMEHSSSSGEPMEQSLALMEMGQVSEFSKRLKERNEGLQLSLSWHNITYWIGTKKGGARRILNQVSGECKAGELLAIMGASGAGKTTLLNVLAGRAAGEGRGSVLLNNAPFHQRDFRRVTAYVLQEDLLFPFLTVRETIRFVAKLRLPTSIPMEEKEKLVEDVISELGLVKCADTIVGNSLTRGISGGEKKRLSIACELVVDPAVIFLDEPTSGLDSFTALNLVSTLRAIAKSGRTVICTIHQPRSGIYSLFDKLLLLAGEGETAYYGSAKGAIRHFNKLGYPCGQFTNPADHFLDVTAINTQSVELIEKSQQRVATLVDAFDGSKALDSPEPKETLDLRHVKHETSFFHQLIVLTQRSAKNVYRDKPRTFFRLLQSIVVAIIIGLIFVDIRSDIVGIQDRIGALFFIMINQAFGGMFASINVFIEEREIFTKERAQSYYRVSPYFIAKSLSEFPMTMVPIVFGIVIYWIIGFNAGVSPFLVFLLIVYLCTFVSESLGLAIAAAAPNAPVAMAIAPLLLVFFLLFGGFYINNDSVGAFWVWLQYWSFIKYGYEALVVNEFTGQVFSGIDPADGVMKERTGEQVIAGLGMSPDSLLLNVLVLIGQGLAYRFVAYLILRFFRRGPRGKPLTPMTQEQQKELETAMQIRKKHEEEEELKKKK